MTHTNAPDTDSGGTYLRLKREAHLSWAVTLIAAAMIPVLAAPMFLSSTSVRTTMHVAYLIGAVAVLVLTRKVVELRRTSGNGPGQRPWLLAAWAQLVLATILVVSDAGIRLLS